MDPTPHSTLPAHFRGRSAGGQWPGRWHSGAARWPRTEGTGGGGVQWGLAAIVLVALALGTRLLGPAGGVAAATVEEPFEAETVAWRLAEADGGPRVIEHDRSPVAPHRGRACERVVIESGAGTMLRLSLPLAAATVIDEWRASLWIRANRPDIRLSARVELPAFPRAASGAAVAVLVPGAVSTDIDRWESLSVGNLPSGLRRQLLALRAEHGPTGDLTGAVVTHLVLELYSGPGRYEVAIDDLLVEGVVATGGGLATAPPAQPGALPSPPPSRPAVVAGPAPVRQVAHGVAEATAPRDPAAGLVRGVLEVAGQPFFPRAIDHAGEPLAFLAALGFNCVRLPVPASGDLLAEARAQGMWVFCPPPTLPDVDVRDPTSLPAFSAAWDRVLAWDLGSGLAEEDVDDLAERARRVRTCDTRPGRPLVAAADSGLRSVSRHIDMLVARRSVLGTSLELGDYLTWLRERGRLTRPGTPVLATLATEIDGRAARQAAALAGIGGRGLAVDPESLSLAALAAVAGGARGLLCTSSRRLDGDDSQSRARAAACRMLNLRLETLDAWAAAGRFAAAAQSSDPEVKAVLLEASRARMVVVYRSVQGAQIVARRYHGDLPAQTPLTLLLPGVPEAHRAWEVSAGGLKPLRQRRVAGGVSVVLDSFLTSTLILVSGDATVAAQTQERLRARQPLLLDASRAEAALSLAGAGEMLSRLPAQALGRLPSGDMLRHASALAGDAEALVPTDPAAAIVGFQTAAAVAGQVERLAWERGIVAAGSMVSDPLATSDATLAEHWRFIDALAAASPGPELLVGGAMERVDELAAAGWRHFVLAQKTIRSGVEIARPQPGQGSGCLVLRAEAVEAALAPAVVETPPVWITTPPVPVPSGKLLQIEARVWVPKPIRGSVDGLLVFDSLGGPALAERVAAAGGWRRLVLHRIAPDDGLGEPLVITFALTGLGEARIDDVSVRVLERGPPGAAPATVPAIVAADRDTAPFPAPEAVLGGAGAAVLPPAATPTPATAPRWPGMDLAWPRILPFGQTTNEPPTGYGGGRVDPFKRVETEADQPVAP